MRILFEVLLLIVIALFAYKAFSWLFPAGGRKKSRILNQVQDDTEKEEEEPIEGEIIK